MPNPTPALPTVNTALDKLDLRILDRVQHNARLPAEAIAAEVGLSAAAVQRRLKRLREAGVIRTEAAQVEPAAVGLAVTCLVGVELNARTTRPMTFFASASPPGRRCSSATT